MCFVGFVQLFYSNSYAKMSVSSNFKKTLDKSAEKEYNGIVNSKGAADMESVALFFGL